MILAPELIIYDNLVKLFNFVNIDYEARTDKTKTILYQIFHRDVNNMRLTFNKVDYYEQAKNIFIFRDNDHKRKVEVNMGFNMERASLPTIHILMPSDTPGSSPIGSNIGYQHALDSETANLKHEVLTISFSSVYNLLITSNNQMEVLIIYLMMKSGFLGLKTQLELLGLQNVVFGGNDLTLSQDMVPDLYTRSFNLSFSYDFGGRDIFTVKIPQSISISPTTI